MFTAFKNSFTDTISRKFAIKLTLEIPLLLLHYFVKYEFSKFAPTAQRQIMRAHTKDNKAMADELLLSQEDETQVHSSTHPAAQFAVVWIIFAPRSWLEATPTEGLSD